MEFGVGQQFVLFFFFLGFGFVSMAGDGDWVVDSGPVVLDISSDEEGESSTDWLSEFFNGDMYGGEDADVVIVGVNPAAPVKYSKGSVQQSKLKSVVCDDDEDECEILDADPDSEKSLVMDSENGSDELLIVAEKGQVRF